MPENKRWIVTASGDRPFDEVEKDLTGAGFTVIQTMEAIGCIVGTIGDEDVEQLKTVPGVADVSPDEIVSIGPPGSGVTW